MKAKLNILNILLGLLLAVGPYTVFKGCESHEKVMRCMYSCRAVMVIGILIAAGEIILMAIKKDGKKAFRAIPVLFFVLSLVAPKVIGGCASVKMRCRSVTFPAVYVISVAGILFNIALLLLKRGDTKEYRGAEK